MPFLPQQMPFLQTSKSATSPVMGAIRCLSIWASLKPTEEVVPTLSAKDRVTNDPWQQMRYPVFIHFFSWLKLRFFLIVLSTSCLWLYWRVDWIKFDDPQKSFLGKWCLRRWKKKSWICWASMQSAMSIICLVSILVNVGKAKVIIV